MGAYFKMKCKKFKGPNEMERIRAVFRWLDPSGEGLISTDEFMILDQMLNEVILSIEEFVEFCVRTFSEDLEDAYQFSTRMGVEKSIETSGNQLALGLAT